MHDHGPLHDPIAIIGHRALTEARLAALLKHAGSAATVEEIKNIILNETSDKPASAYFANLVSLFDAPEGTMDLDAVLQVVEDAWNYFPHRSLSGQCPAELFAQHIQPDAAPIVDMTTIDPDADKIDEAVLALLLLGLHGKIVPPVMPLPLNPRHVFRWSVSLYLSGHVRAHSHHMANPSSEPPLS
jgi:hypothetical protein